MGNILAGTEMCLHFFALIIKRQINFEEKLTIKINNIKSKKTYYTYKNLENCNNN